MAQILERELLDRISGPKHKIVVIGPGNSPEIDPTTLYLCTRVTHSQGQITVVDSQIGSPLEFREIPGWSHLIDKLMQLKLISGGEGNAMHHVEEIEAFKKDHPEIFVHVPKIQPASGFETELPDNSATAALNRGSLYWMLTKRRDAHAVKVALMEMLRVAKPGHAGLIFNEDEVLPDKHISIKIRKFLRELNVPFEEFDVQNEPYSIGGKKFEPAYRYQKAFLFTKPLQFGEYLGTTRVIQRSNSSEDRTKRTERKNP